MDVNQFPINLLGYSRARIIGKAVWEIGGVKDFLPRMIKEQSDIEAIGYENNDSDRGR